MNHSVKMLHITFILQIIEDPSTGLTSGTGPKHIIFQDGVPKVVVRDVPVANIQRSGCEWRPTKMPMSQMRTWGIPTTEKPTVEPGLITRRLVSRVISIDLHCYLLKSVHTFENQRKCYT